ncbi:MAG: XRE family transcriptional regulator [Lachnospiraceae bacterium]|nr:XRE family transcriptional regulator [Lachnospiraceae bacterium]
MSEIRENRRRAGGKDTQMLQSELKNAESPEAFVAANQAELQTKTVAEYLNEMLIKYNLEKCDVNKGANLAGNYFYQVCSGTKSPGRDKLIQIALGFPLTLAETQYLLRLGGHSELYVRNSRDAFLMFAIEKGYGIQRVNELLYENKKELLE